MDTSVSIGLKNNSKDSEFFKKVQEALDSISDKDRNQYMLDAVNNAPTSEE